MDTKLILSALLAGIVCLTPHRALAQSSSNRQAREQAREAATQHALAELPGDRTVSDDSLAPAHSQANFARAKVDAAELVALAKELREELNKPNADLLSPEVLGRTKRIGKLAKKIREETTGN